MATINHTSMTNQRICSRLVEREVYYCVSSLVSHFAENHDAINGSDYTEDDVYALLSCDDWQTAWEESGYTLHEDSTGDLYALTEADAARLAACTTFDPDEFDELDEARDDIITDGEAVDCDSDDWKGLCEAVGIDPETREAYEHRIVSDWLARRLSERGEITGELFGLTIWGRCCTGQAIHLDSVIGEIAEEMGILDGQEHSWAE